MYFGMIYSQLNAFLKKHSEMVITVYYGTLRILMIYLICLSFINIIYIFAFRNIILTYL